MAQITVLDSAGATQTVAKVVNTGATTAANSLPVTLATDDALIIPIGAITETAPLTDTGNAGLNGRLQRIAQRITALIALLPASLGSKAAASSLAITQSTEDAAQLGSLTEAAPGTDTASSGLNGRAQRVAQNITSSNTKLDTLHTDLTSTNAQLPTTVSGSNRITITRPANATAYTAGDVVGAAAAALTFTTGLTSGQRGMITSADIEYDIAALGAGNPTWRLYLYNITPPSALADNAAFDLPSGDRASYLGYIDIGASVDLGSTQHIQAANLNQPFQLSGSANLFAYLVSTTGFTPAGNSEVIQARMHFVGL